MKNVVRKIDRALKRLYQLDSPYRAEDFLVQAPLSSAEVQAASRRKTASDFAGALFVQSHNVAPNEAPDVSLGIYLSDSVGAVLKNLKFRKKWTVDQLGAFSVATEEVSHFHYLLFHLAKGRPISQLELELQGEVDKFMLAYFVQCNFSNNRKTIFGNLFEQFFDRFHFDEKLTDEEYSRYRAASEFAKLFLQKNASLMTQKNTQEKAIQTLRHFYRLSASEKISYAQR